METENKDVKNKVEDQKTADVVNQQIADSQVATGAGEKSQIQAADESKEPVPYERFQQTITEKNQEKAEKELFKAQLAEEQKRVNELTQRILAGQQPQQIQDFYSAQGLKDEDPVVLTVAQQRAKDNYNQQQIIQALQMQSFLASHGDFPDIVGKPNLQNRTFDTAEPLKKVMLKNPALQGLDILAAQNPAFMPIAYQLASMQKQIDEMEKTTGASAEFLKQQQIDTKVNPQSVSSVGGGANVNLDAKISQLDPNSPEFNELVDKVRRGEFKQ